MDINNLTDEEVRNLEARLRRKLKRDGEILKKGKNNMGSPGYMIVDANTNAIVAGGQNNGFNLDLEDVIKYTESE